MPGGGENSVDGTAIGITSGWVKSLSGSGVRGSGVTVSGNGVVAMAGSRVGGGGACTAS